MDISLQAGMSGGFLGDLISPLLCDVTSLSRWEQVVIPAEPFIMGINEYRCHQPILDEHHALNLALPQYSDAIFAHITQTDPYPSLFEPFLMDSNNNFATP